ncbi:hypothetical protein BX616_004920 [Lobosporangium transversale]|nr:hypothetical protein BX616_004920 [Lobosporangium transversale]
MEDLTASLQALDLDENTRASVQSAIQAFIRSNQDNSSAATAFNDHIRTVAAVIKPPKPEPYDGAVDDVEVLNFLESQEEYFQIMELNHACWARCTVIGPKRGAKVRWRDCGLTIDTLRKLPKRFYRKLYAS